MSRTKFWRRYPDQYHAFTRYWPRRYTGGRIFTWLCVFIVWSNVFASDRETVSTNFDSTDLVTRPGNLEIDERVEHKVAIDAVVGTRIVLEGAPPGSHFDAKSKILRLFPDFTQGGRTYTVNIHAAKGRRIQDTSFDITIRDNIRPPDPIVVEEGSERNGYRVFRVRIDSDEFLDAPGMHRSFNANVTVPSGATKDRPLPVKINLHGSGGGPGVAGNRLRFGIDPHEPYAGWWTSQADTLPNDPGANATIPNYSQRRILLLLDWATRTFPGLDRNRVTIAGSSMGASGAFFFALRYGYHIASVQGNNGMTSFAVARPQMRKSMEKYWGLESRGLLNDLGTNVWKSYDISSAIRDVPFVRNVYFESNNGVKDGIISFAHVSGRSPWTELSWADAAQQFRIGHRIFWDQRGHALSEGAHFRGYWVGKLPPQSELRLDVPFPAFTQSSADQSPPVPKSSASREFSGGDLRGARNRYLSWITHDIVDEWDRLVIPLFADVDTTVAPPEPGYPTSGKGYLGKLPILASVTPRRVTRFVCLAGETVRWTFGNKSGTVTANDDGSVTIPMLPIVPEVTRLVLERES